MNEADNRVDDFLKNFGETDNAEKSQWDKVIQPSSSYLIAGDVGTGKSGLAYWLLERFSQVHNLIPVTVGVPKQKRELLPDGFTCLDSVSDCTGLENAIVFIDEADIQLPMENRKMKEYVVNFLSLPRHRNSIFLLAFHFPRLVMGTYLPFFNAFLLKRPPYLLEFASKGESKAIMGMMEKAEERFAEFPSQKDGTPSPDVVKHTYVVAPRLRWQGILENPLCSFWTEDLSKVWAGTGVIERQGDRLIPSDQLKLSALLVRQDEDVQSNTTLRLSKLQSLFPEGIPFDKVIEYDKHFSLDELRQQCRDAGIPASGDKKELAAKLIANETTVDDNEPAC